MSGFRFNHKPNGGFGKQSQPQEGASEEKTLEQKLEAVNIKVGKLEGEGVGSGPIEAPGLSKTDAENNFVRFAKKYGVTNVDGISYTELNGGRYKVSGRGYVQIAKSESK